MIPSLAPPLPSRDCNPGALPVHVLASIVYAVVVWLALLAWLTISSGPVLLFLLVTPFLLSGLIIVITAAALAFVGLRWLWQRRGLASRLIQAPRRPVGSKNPPDCPIR